MSTRQWCNPLKLMLTSFSHLAQLVSDTTQITKAAILHMFLTMDKVKTDKIFSNLLCYVCLYHHQIEAREKKVCLYGQLPELSGCQLLNVDAMQSLHQVERVRPFPACLWAVFWGLLTVFYLFSFSQLKWMVALWIWLSQGNQRQYPGHMWPHCDVPQMLGPTRI